MQQQNDYYNWGHKALLTTFLNRFVNRQDCHYQQRNNGAYFLVKEPITADLLQHHLDGDITLGVPSVSENQTCNWVCFDDDSADAWRFDRIEMICDNDCLYPMREGARDDRMGHMWLFFDEALPLSIAYDFGIIIRAQCGISIPSMEYFPKQRIMKEGSIGNCVKMPLGIHRKLLPDIWRPTFANCELQMPEEQLQWFCDQPLSSAATIRDIVAKTPIQQEKKKKSIVQAASKIDLMLSVPDHYPIKVLPSGERQTKCPACDLEGHDNKCANLNIDPTGHLMCCQYNNRQHGFIQILKAFTEVKRRQGIVQ